VKILPVAINASPEHLIMTSLMFDRPIDLGVTIPTTEAAIEGDWSIPLHPKGVIIVANGTGNSRLSRRNREVAQHLYDAGYATLLLDLITPLEDREDSLTGVFQTNIELLASRLIDAGHWVETSEARDLPLGFLTSGVASAAAVVAAVREPELVDALVFRGGRPDLGGIALHKLLTPSLFIVGGADHSVFELNRWALRRIRGEGRIAVIPTASHLFEEPGTLEQMCRLAVRWFDGHLRKTPVTLAIPRFETTWSLAESPAG
jgi:putative phosphoribosyl transferase